MGRSNGKVDLDEFISRATEIHGEKYDYSRVSFESVRDKVEIVCPEHGPFLQTTLHHYRGSQCPECARSTAQNAKRLSLGSVREKLKALHPELDFSKVQTYRSQKDRVEVGCPVHGWYETNVGSLLSGGGCKKCGREKGGSKRKRVQSTPDFISKAVSVHGNTYDYSNTSVPEGALVDAAIDIACRKHGRFTQTIQTHLSGVGCAKCSQEARASGQRHDVNRVLTKIGEAHSHKYIPVVAGYVNTKARIKVWCGEHGYFGTTAELLTSGRGCKKCGYARNSATFRKGTEYFLQRAREVHGDKYEYDLAGYEHSHSMVQVQCPSHGWFEQASHCHTNLGHGCPKCSTGKDSKPQVQIADWVEQHGFTAVRNAKVLGGQEVDVYIPELKVGIEYHGVYFHSTRLKADKNYHVNKLRTAEKEGICLIQLFSDEWDSKQNACESIIRNLLGVGSTLAVYARKCEVREVPQHEAAAFYAENHIQGKGVAGDNAGLYYRSELVACMTFSKRGTARGAPAGEGHELSRYATSINVPGGASRLFKALLNRTQASSVVSFSDNRLFTGGMYEALGFTKESISRPDYKYVDRSGGRTRIHKSKFQRKHLPKLLGDSFDPKKSERENCEAAGYYQIFDCGLTRWRYTRT